MEKLYGKYNIHSKEQKLNYNTKFCATQVSKLLQRQTL